MCSLIHVETIKPETNRDKSVEMGETYVIVCY